MSDPAMQGPEGLVARQKLLDGGYKPEEVDQWQQQTQQEQFQKGWDPKDIDAYWGKNPDMSGVKAAVDQSFQTLGDGDKARIAETPWDMFRAGLQTSAVEIPFGKPTILPPQHAGMASNILYRFGQGAGDLPATVLGWMGGKAVGALAGGAAASAAGPEAAPVGAAVGGLIGAGAGSAALPEVWRQAWMDHQANPDGYKTWSEFWSHTAEIMHDAGKQALIGAVSAPLGGLAGHAVGGALAEGAGAAIASRAADTVTMAGAATAVGAALDGHVPTTDDLATAAVLTLGFHAAGEFHGATMRFRPSEPAQVVQANLRDAYVATGRNPMAIAQIAHSDVAVQGEVLGPTAADGTRLTPALDAMKLDEPPPFVKPPETPTEPEAGAPPVKEPETSASEGVKNENGLTHEEQALADKATTAGHTMTDEEFQQHIKNSENPAYIAAIEKNLAEENARFENETSPTLALQGDTPEWVPPAVGHINEPNIIEPLPAQPTDYQKANFHIDPVTRKPVAWSESRKAWGAPDSLGKSDWQHLQGLIEPKIGQAEKEPTSWWHGSQLREPYLDPAKAFQNAANIKAVWVSSSRATADMFTGLHKGAKEGTITRIHIAPGKYFDFRDATQHDDFSQWMREQGMSETKQTRAMENMQGGMWEDMEDPAMQRFLRERGYEGYFERERPNHPVNLAVYDKAKIMRDESAPSPVKRQMLRLKSEQAEAEKYAEPGQMLSVYAHGERMTPEEEAAARPHIVSGDLAAAGGGEPPTGGGLGPHTGPEGEPPKPETWQEANKALLDTIDPAIKKGILPDWLNPRKWLAGFQGQLTPARQLDMMLGSDLKQMTIEDHAREGSYASGGRVNSFFRHGNLRIIDSKKWTMARVDDASQTAAYQAVKEDGGNVADFTTLRMALRTLEKAQQGIDIHPVLTPERALARLQEPGWQDKYSRGLKIMKEHTDGVVNYAQDAHLFSPELADAYKTNNKIHINLRRVMNPDYDKQGGGGAGIFNPTKKLKGGSDRPFDDVVSAGFKNTDAIISMADRNLFHLNTIDHVLERPSGLKQLGYDGFSRIEAKDLESGALLNGHLVDEEGTPLTEAEKQGMLPFLAQRQFNARPNANRGDYLVFRNGKPEVYHTDNADLQAVLGMASHATPHAVFQVAIKLAGLERAGIIGSPGFLLRSLTHQQTASAVTGRGEAAIPFLNMWKGIMPEMLGGVGKDAWEEAAAHGVGTESTIGTLDFSRDPLLSKTTRTFDKAGTWSTVMNMARAPFDAWRALSNRLHQASAVAGYQKLKMQGYDPGKAAMITRTDYLDHAEPLAASFANTFARMTPFMSTGLKDIEQLGRALQDRPVSTIMNGLVKLTLPTLALSYVNDQVDKTLPPGSRYSDLPEWRRLLFWNIPVAGVHIAIPKPYAVGFLFAGMPQMMMENMRDGRPADFKHIGAALAQQMMPPFIPTAAAPILDNLTNTHFPSSVPLVPASLAGVTGWMQYKADTSGAAKKLSQVLGPAGMNVANFSPIVLDNYIQKWAGTLPMQAFRAIGAPWAAPGPPKTWSDNPLFGSFIVRNPGAHSQVVEDLFDKIHEFETAHASFKLAEKHMDPEELQYNKTAQAEAQIGIIKRSLTHQMGMLNAINSSKVMTDEEKTKRGDYLSQYMVKSAEHSLAYMNRIAK